MSLDAHGQYSQHDSRREQGSGLRPAVSSGRKPISPDRIDGRRASRVGLGRAIQTAGSSHSIEARRLSVDSSTITRLCDADDDSALYLGDLRVMSPSVQLAYHEGRLAELTEAMPSVVALEMLALRIGREYGELAGRVEDAISDGRVDDTERVAIRREVHDQISALRRLLSRLGG